MENTAPPLPEAGPSDRKFGWTFAVIFLLLGIFHPFMVGVAVLFAAVTFARAELLGPLNRAWMKLGTLLHHVVSPVIMGLMYFGLFTPMGFVMRRFGWDAMKRAWDPAAKTYWTKRDPAGPADDSFRNLF